MSRKPPPPSDADGEPLRPGFVRSHAGIAHVFGVSVDTVKNWSRRGMPKRTPDGYDLSAVWRWWLRLPQNREHLIMWAEDHLRGIDLAEGIVDPDE